ncbi:MAG: hypothetical protein U7127_10535 [Phormidium sp.]
MADKSKKSQNLKCPLTKEQQEQIKEVADTVEKHRKIIKKITG